MLVINPRQWLASKAVQSIFISIAVSLVVVLYFLYNYSITFDTEIRTVAGLIISSQNASEYQTEEITYLSSELADIKNTLNASPRVDTSAQAKILKLQAQLDIYNQTLQKLITYINSLNFTNVTINSTQFIYINQTINQSTPKPPIENYSQYAPDFLKFQYSYLCMNELIEEYNLGGYVCLRADCSRNVGWQQDACACWNTFKPDDKYRC